MYDCIYTQLKAWIQRSLRWPLTSLTWRCSLICHIWHHTPAWTMRSHPRQNHMLMLWWMKVCPVSFWFQANASYTSIANWATLVVLYKLLWLIWYWPFKHYWCTHLWRNHSMWQFACMPLVNALQNNPVWLGTDMHNYHATSLANNWFWAKHYDSYTAVLSSVAMHKTEREAPLMTLKWSGKWWERTNQNDSN